jgi:hypothetical protein
MPRLENWSITTNYGCEFIAPTLKSSRVRGIIYGDTKNRFEDGTDIITSKIISCDLDDGRVKTQNTTYQLGEPDPKYIKFLTERLNNYVGN